MSTRVASPDNLPDKTGVYIMKDKQDQVLYVGKSVSLKKRVKSYFKADLDSPRTRILMNHFNSLEYIITDNEKEALILEANLIKKYKPPYNIRLKDDKRYPYIKITKEKYPRLLITRKISPDGSYFGPFTDVTAVRKTLKFIKALFKIRECKRMDGPCLNSQIDLCYAPCADGISTRDYQQLIKQIELFFQGKYSQIIQFLEEEMKKAAINHEFERAGVLRDQIQAIEEVMERQFVSSTAQLDQDIISGSIDKKMGVMVVFSVREGKIIGKDDFLMTGVEDSSEKEIISAFIRQYYANPRYVPAELMLPYQLTDEKLIEEWLSELRGLPVHLTVPQEGLPQRMLNMATKNAEVIRNQKKQVKNALVDLKKYLKLPKIPLVIEAFDVSNIGGKSAVGSMVQFQDAQPRKGQYRRYKLHSSGPDDYAMMEELLYRRYKHLIEDGKTLPDLILVDGGKGQLNVALKTLKSLNLNDTPVIGLAKEYEEVFIPQMKEALILPRDSPALILLQRIRDEAHRFAINYHRQLRSQKLEQSPLDEIKGIGSKRKMNLMRFFGDLDKIKKASPEKLMLVKGMNRKLAEEIYHYFQNEDQN